MFEVPHLTEYKQILNDKPLTLTSRFKISYHLIINTIKNNSLTNISSQSLMNQEIGSELNQLTNELRDIDNSIDASKQQLTRTNTDVLDRCIELMELIPLSKNKIRKNFERELKYIHDENKFIEQDIVFIRNALNWKESEKRIRII